MQVNTPYNMEADKIQITEIKGLTPLKSKQMGKKASRKSKRCNHNSCKKKLKLTDYACRCRKRFCQRHRLPEMHTCKVDYKTLNQADFIKKAGLISCIPQKINVI